MHCVEDKIPLGNMMTMSKNKDNSYRFERKQRQKKGKYKEQLSYAVVLIKLRDLMVLFARFVYLNQ